MRRVLEARHELLGHGRRRKEDPRLLAARAGIGLVTVAGSMTASVIWTTIPQLAVSVAGGIGVAILLDALTRVPSRRFSRALQRALGLIQRVVLVILVLAGSLADVSGALLLGWVMVQGPSGPSGTWGLAGGALGLLAIGTVFLSAGTEPTTFSVENRRWPEQVGDAGSLVLAAGVLLGLTASTWHLAGVTGVLTVACAVSLAQIGWLITARLHRARAVSALATATGALAIAALGESSRPGEAGPSPLLRQLLDLEALVQQGSWRLPLSHRPRQLFDSEVHAMIEALLAVALSPDYGVRPMGLARRLHGELQVMAYSERMAETALFAADLRHLCTRARPWVRERPTMAGPSVMAAEGARQLAPR